LQQQQLSEQQAKPKKFSFELQQLPAERKKINFTGSVIGSSATGVSLSDIDIESIPVSAEPRKRFSITRSQTVEPRKQSDREAEKELQVVEDGLTNLEIQVQNNIEKMKHKWAPQLEELKAAKPQPKSVKQIGSVFEAKSTAMTTTTTTTITTIATTTAMTNTITLKTESKPASPVTARQPLSFTSTLPTETTTTTTATTIATTIATTTTTTKTITTPITTEPTTEPIAEPTTKKNSTQEKINEKI